MFRQDRVVFVQPGDVIRLDSDCRGHVFTQDKTGAWVRSGKKVNLPAGCYAGSLDINPTKPTVSMSPPWSKEIVIVDYP
jgi:hypothetical protein